MHKSEDEITQLLKKFEPAMHQLLHKYKVKQDYEDNLQELRLAAWKAIENYDKKKKACKLFTYVYTNMKNRLLNIIKTEYRTKVKVNEDNEKEIEQMVGYGIVHPAPLTDLTFHQLMTVLKNDIPAEEIRTKLDFETFCSILNKNEQDVLALRCLEYRQTDIAEELKMTTTRVNRIIKNLRIKFNKFIKE